jgi:hypothetical protein
MWQGYLCDWVLSVGNVAGVSVARYLFSSSVSRTLSEKWKVKVASESCVGGFKLEQVT